MAAGLSWLLCLGGPFSTALAQQPAIAPVRPTAPVVVRPYLAVDVPPARLDNSSRLRDLIKDGKLYLTAQDAIALALENNIDLELARYAPITSAWNLERAEAGGALPGVPSGASQASSVASGQGVAGSQAAAGVHGASTAATTGASNASISQIGPVTQTLDPAFQLSTTFSHQTAPQPDLVQSGTPALISNSRIYSSSLQEGFLSGGSASLSYTNHFLNENAPSDVLNPSVAPSLSLSVQHNLLQGFGTKVGGRTITISKINLKTSDLNFRSQVIGVVVSVLNAYYSLVAADEDVIAKNSARDVARTFLDDSNKQLQIGTISETDLITARSQIATATQDLVISETTRQQDETALKNLLSRQGLADPQLASARIVTLDRLTMPQQDDLPPVKQLVEKAFANRVDLEAEKAGITTSQISALGTKNGLLPVLVAFGTTSNAGLAGTPQTISQQGQVETADRYFVGSTGTALGQIFRRNFPSESGGLYFQATLRNRQAQADYTIDGLQLRQTELNVQKDLKQAQVDVMNSVVAIQQARARYDASLHTRDLAQQLLDAEQKKFGIGTTTPFNVVQMQRDLTTAQSAMIAALVTYRQAQISLQQATGTALEQNGINIAEAQTGIVSRQSVVPASTLPNQQ
jgi:outer membrane protein TolC